MAPASSSRWLPGTRGWLVALAVVPCAGDLLSAALGATSRSLALHSAALLAFGVLAVLLRRRARVVRHERPVWIRMATGALILVAGTALTITATALAVSRGFAQLPVEWAPAAAFPWFYGGLVRWNRTSTSLADPNDVLNGCSAVLAVVAVLDLFVHTGPAGHLAFWHEQALLSQAAVGFVLVGTAVSVAFMGAMGRSAVTWLVVGAFTMPLVGAALGIAAVDLPGSDGLGASLGVVLFSLAAVWLPARAPAQPTDPTASTVGAFIVIVACTAILATAAFLGEPSVVTCAALAAVGSSIRLLVNVRELALLAVSRREALTDELTGLANRRAVLRRVDELCDAGSALVLALLDLDKFKEVNDGLGHAAGDELLRLVAARLAPVLRADDVVGRLGGDEFAVVATVDDGVSPEDAALRLAARLRGRFAEPFPVGGLSVHTAVSIGITAGSGDAAVVGNGRDAAARLLRQADAAMYDAKRSGAGIAVFDRRRHVDSSGHLALVEELRAGLAAGQLVLHHQPQLDVHSGRVVGVEALARWQHPVRGLLPPAEFLPLAEVHGLMGAVSDEVLRQAVDQLAAWRAEGLDLRMSVNLSASNLLDTGLPRRVAGLLAAADVPPDVLVLEVTESVLLTDPERSLAVVAALEALGVAVSIDDFGTGYSSLAYLAQLPVAELKLDRSFTAGMLTEDRTGAIVKSTIDLAHRLGLRVVAEGVEQAETLARLEELGCDESQGYLHARPLPADELVAWIARRAQLVG